MRGAGTSAGAPQWAGLIAVANQGRALSGRAPADRRAGRRLYSLPAGDFRDVTSGGNGTAAGRAFDLATGRGSPYADRVVRDLVGAAAARHRPEAGHAPKPRSTSVSSRAASPCSCRRRPANRGAKASPRRNRRCVASGTRRSWHRRPRRDLVRLLKPRKWTPKWDPVLPCRWGQAGAAGRVPVA